MSSITEKTVKIYCFIMFYDKRGHKAVRGKWIGILQHKANTFFFYM